MKAGMGDMPTENASLSHGRIRVQGPPPAILMQTVSKVYRASGIETHALSGVTVSIDPGEFVAIMGPSGCGKSTLLNIIGMIDSPSAGTYRFQGEDVSHAPERRLAEIRQASMGFIFQSFNLIDELTIWENVDLGVRYRRIATPDRKAMVEDALDKLNIAHRRTHFPQQLSGGQQQRAAIARAIVSKPALLLADEPTGNLDSQNGEEVMQILQALNDQGTTVVVVTHSPAHAQYARRTIHLLDGQVVAENLRGR